MNSNDERLRQRLMRDFDGYEVEPSADFWDRLAPTLPAAKPPTSRGIVAALLTFLVFVPVVSGDWQATHPAGGTTALIEPAGIYPSRQSTDPAITPDASSPQKVTMPVTPPNEAFAAPALAVVTPGIHKARPTRSSVQGRKGPLQPRQERSFAIPTRLSSAAHIVSKSFAPQPTAPTPAFETNYPPNNGSTQFVKPRTEPNLDVSFPALSTYLTAQAGFPDTPGNLPGLNKPTQQRPTPSRFRWQLAFSPLLAYNTITPTVQGGVMAQRIQTEPTLSSRRVGWQAEVGFVKSVTRLGQVTGSVVLRQFHQAIAYEVPNGQYDVRFTGPATAIVKRLGDTYHLSEFTRQLGLRVAYEQILWKAKQSGLVASAGASAVMARTGTQLIPSVDVSAMYQRSLTAQLGFRVGLYMNYTLESQFDPVFQQISWQPYQTGLKVGLDIGHK